MFGNCLHASISYLKWKKKRVAYKYFFLFSLATASSSAKMHRRTSGGGPIKAKLSLQKDKLQGSATPKVTNSASYLTDKMFESNTKASPSPTKGDLGYTSFKVSDIFGFVQYWAINWVTFDNI